jgi:DNA-binding CsgD family transcriptional regulator
MTPSVDSTLSEVLIICVMVAHRLPGDFDSEADLAGPRESSGASHQSPPPAHRSESPRSDGEESAPLPGDRIAELESRLRRIAAELKAAGVMDDLDTLPPLADHQHIPELSHRQREILIRLLNAQRVSVIAAELCVSPSTVRNHLMTIFSKFGVHSQAELVAVLRRRPPSVSTRFARSRPKLTV